MTTCVELSLKEKCVVSAKGNIPYLKFGIEYGLNTNCIFLGARKHANSYSIKNITAYETSLQQVILTKLCARSTKIFTCIQHPVKVSSEEQSQVGMTVKCRNVKKGILIGITKQGAGNRRLLHSLKTILTLTKRVTFLLDRL